MMTIALGVVVGGVLLWLLARLWPVLLCLGLMAAVVLGLCAWLGTDVATKLGMLLVGSAVASALGIKNG